MQEARTNFPSSVDPAATVFGLREQLARRRIAEAKMQKIAVVVAKERKRIKREAQSL